MDRRQFVNTSLLAALVNIVKGMTKEKHTKMTKPNKGKIVVIGAGAFGGWTAFHLLDRGYDVSNTNLLEKDNSEDHDCRNLN